MSVLDNLANHWDVVKASWREQRQQEKDEGGQPTAKGHELEFLPAVLEITETPASPTGRAVALVIVIFFNVALTWAVFGEIDIVAVAQGKIIPTSQVKKIQPLESGIIRSILVEEGQAVSRGQILVELDPTGTQADVTRLADEFMAARLEVARLDALSRDDPEKAYVPPDGIPARDAEEQRALLASQWNERKARLAELQAELARYKSEAASIRAEIRSLERIIPKVRERVERRRPLVKKGVVAEMTFLELEEELEDRKGKLEVQKSRLDEAKANFAAAEARRGQMTAEFRRDTLTRLTEARTKAASLEQELIKARERGRQQTLTAPVEGMVQQLAVHTEGGVVTPAQELMVIVPADTGLEIEAMVQNKDIGFVRDDQEAEIKVESFPFTKYGTIDGVVRHVSRDSVQDEQQGLIYPARVTMARTTMQTRKKTVNLGPGMAVTVEIKTGKRKLIEYLLAPLQRYKADSLRER